MRAYTCRVLVCVTASHGVMPLDILEQLADTGDAVARTLVDGYEAVDGAVVVATCNRFEAYLDLEEPLSPAADLALEMVLDELAQRTGLAPEQLGSGFRVHSGLNVVEHLFSVATGLESVAVGETEIAGQVRQALEGARRGGTTSRDLERAFQQASQTSRGVRAATGLDKAGRSLVQLALDLAASRIGDWPGTRVVLVGTGRFAKVVVAGLRRRGVHDIAVHSPSGRAAAFAIPRGLQPLTAEQAPEALAEADVIVTASGAGVVVHPSQLGRREQLVIDLGLPRNVDPAVGALADVTLLDLETVRLHAPLDEFATTDDARELVRAATRDYADEQREQQAAPAIAALHRHVAAVLDAEVARSAARGDGPEVAAAMRHLVGVLLHEPTMRAREFARDGDAARFTEAVEAMFPVVVEPLHGAERDADRSAG
jgi:glutamyl-tRNA reductase